MVQNEDQDLILVPCNPESVVHWFLLAIFPQQKWFIVLDSKSSVGVKPTSKNVIATSVRALSVGVYKNLELFINKKSDM